MYTFDKNKIQDRFNQCVESFKKSIIGISAKVSASILDSIKCEVYGSMAPISNFASVSIVDAKTLLVKIWDSSTVQPIYKALQTSQLGINPVLEGQTILLPFPPMSTERRKSMMELVKTNLEQAKVSVRNVRRDENDKIKDGLKNKFISEDQDKKYQEEVQKIHDATIKILDELAHKKNEELAKV
jgi:ribosome recycling factor